MAVTAAVSPECQCIRPGRGRRPDRPLQRAAYLGRPTDTTLVHRHSAGPGTDWNGTQWVRPAWSGPPALAGSVRVRSASWPPQENRTNTGQEMPSQ